MKVTFKVALENTTVETDITFPDNTTDEEIEESYIEWRNEQVHGGWESNDRWVEVE